MKIVIDLQGRQTIGSRNRGIGRYSLSITKAIIRNRKEHDILVVLSDSFEDTIKEIENELISVLPENKLFIWKAPKNTAYINSSITYRKTAELDRELFLHSLNPDLIYITSLFEGFGDDAVTSVKSIASKIPVVTTLYDLIPLINQDIYLENIDIKNWYEGRIRNLKKVDLLLSISESSRQEALKFLETDPNHVVNIKTAADSQFKKIEIDEAEKKIMLDRYLIESSFLMYTGGIDHRKNIEGLIYAYGLLSNEIRNNHQLVIVCSIDENQKSILEKVIKSANLKTEEVIFTGFIPEENLIVLYNICKAFIFPSWHEGFGLPALEAMHCGVPVIASNNSSLPEVIGLKEALFDAKDHISMSRKIEEVLTDESFRNRLIAHSKEQVKNFTWDNSAKIAINAFERIIQEEHEIIYSKDRLKLAYISPLPSEHTGIADYSAELLPELYNYYDIDVVVEQEKVSDDWIEKNCKILNTEEFIENVEKYDRIIYHFGNSHFHKYMFDLIKYIPGIVVLHDFYLSGSINYVNSIDKDSFSLSDELYYSHGEKIEVNAENVISIIDSYPCSKRVLDTAKGVIVHSKYSKKLASKWYGKNYGKNWKVIPHLRVPSNIDKNRSRKNLNIHKDTFMVSSFGIIATTKQNDRLLNAWLNSSLSKDKNCKLYFVGDYLNLEYGKKLLRKINSSKLNNIYITGRVDNEVFKDYLAATDIGVQLRTLSRGETSGTVLDSMNYSIATIVNANGSMAELEKDTVFMLANEFTDEDLIKALEKLYEDKYLQKKLAKNARKLIESLHAPVKCAHQYVLSIEEYYRSDVSMPKASGTINLENLYVKKSYKGLLTYGPYITLNQKENLFKLSYSSSKASNCRFDIVADGGNVLLKDGVLSSSTVNGLIEEYIELPKKLRGLKFEFRVFYEGEGELTINALEINDSLFLGADLPGQTGWVYQKTKTVKESKKIV